MTIIITALTANKVIQASDRRLTFSNGGIFDDEANKAVCVSCKDAYFSMAYTGLALINSIKTDEWLVDYLISIKAFQLDLASIVKGLEKHLTVVFAPLPGTCKRATFVLAGYRYPRSLPFMVIISNFERENIWPPGEAQDAFLSYCLLMKKNSHPEKAYSIAINGMQQAFGRDIKRSLNNLIRSNFFQENESKVVADKLVSFIREAAESPRFGQYIGQSCMAVTMSPNPSDSFVARYYPDKASPYLYSPHLLAASGIAFKEVEVWIGKGPSPWRNTPC